MSTIRPISQENVGYGFGRKPGTVNNLKGKEAPRKAFGERSVNGSSPNLKCNKIHLKQEQFNPKIEDEEENLTNYDIYSYVEPQDNFVDICPIADKRTAQQMMDIFTKFMSYENEDLELPAVEESKFLKNIQDYSYRNDHSLEDIEYFSVLEDSFEISLPKIDFE